MPKPRRRPQPAKAPPATAQEQRPSAQRSVAAFEADLDWSDSPAAPASPEDRRLVERWVKRGSELLRLLAEHGVAGHEYRADLREGRFVWVDVDGRVSAEARTQVVCSWSRATQAVAMGWADPLLRSSAVPRVPGMPDERDAVDEEIAWRIAMRAAECSGAEYLQRVPTPHAWYFLGLRDLSFGPPPSRFTPGSPVGMAIRELGDLRAAVESGLEPTDVMRNRLLGLGGTLLQHGEYAYRGTDWVARLERTGKRLLHLAGTLPRGSFGGLAAGGTVDEWLPPAGARELAKAIGMLEEEWALFA